MNLATPAPKVESVEVEPARAVEEATAEPAKAVAPAETVDNPRKHAPKNALNNLQEKNKISVATLREQGIDFESRVAVVKGGAPKKSWFKLMFPIFFDQRDFVTFSEISRYAVVQTSCCFIFLESTDLTPLYAFNLCDMQAEIEDRDNPDKYSCTVNPSSNTNKTGEGLKVILLRERNTAKIAYQFTFDVSKDKSVVKRFLDVMHSCSAGSAAVAEASVTTGASKEGKKERK